MADASMEWWGISLSVDEDGESISRWQAVKLAWRLVRAACSRKPKRDMRGVPAPRPLGPEAKLILDRALSVLQAKPAFLNAINAKYDAKAPIKMGDTIKIRQPQPFTPRCS